MSSHSVKLASALKIFKSVQAMHLDAIKNMQVDKQKEIRDKN